MIADDNFTVGELNARAQADRVAAGQVQDGGVELGDGATAGVGALVVTRRNDRTLATGSGWVKNGHTWTVMGIDPDGALRVRRSGGTGSTHLPRSTPFSSRARIRHRSPPSPRPDRRHHPRLRRRNDPA